MTDTPESPEPLWPAVDELIDRSPRCADLVSHGLHLLAARRWRRLNLAIPQAIEQEERNAALRSVVVPLVLERLTDAAGEPLVVIKGAAVAARYPHPTLRPFSDIDVLAVDAERVHRRLLDAGFSPLARSSDYDGRHHLAPVALPHLPMLVEVHRRPEWVTWCQPPSAGEIVSRAVPLPSGPEGTLIPSPCDHALLIAAHSWATLPLRRVLDLIDISLLADAAGRANVADQANRWRLNRVWATMLRAADAMLGDGPVPLPLRTWAVSLRAVRDLTVLESHVRRIVSPFWAVPPGEAAAASIVALRRELAPGPEEDWRSKRERMGAALRRPLSPKARHDRVLSGTERARRRT